MRVAVHLPPEHPEHGGGVEGRAVVAYRLGRIEEGVHNAPVGHPAVPLEDFVASLVSQAQVDYPDAEVRVERLVDNGDGTSRWIDASEFDPEVHAAPGPGNIQSAEIHVTSEQAAGGAE